MSAWVDVGRLADWDSSGPRRVELQGTPVAVFKLGEAFYAIEDVCSHDGAPLADGAVEGSQIICPRHGARFCIRTGTALTPPAYESIRTFPVRVDGDIVQVCDPRGPME
ncbi:MAG: Rieske (2Fe-2S) protein [Gammaproteobacteria bacterium]